MEVDCRRKAPRVSHKFRPGTNFLTLLTVAMMGLGACGGGGAEEASGEKNMENEHAFTNRLIHEKSPYLQQHAHNPVEWFPWRSEALEKARTEDKPIFLSIGYSTCHWCHVMEHESFENEAIAAILNQNFVAIKVDREERPDLDGLYMTAVQGMTGRGGWPMSVFLTPDLKPFFAGTYFPPDDRNGNPGFKTLLTNIATAWKENRPALSSQADKVAAFLREQTTPKLSESAQADLKEELLDLAYRNIEGSYDGVLGGFGAAPKFPTPHKVTYLLRYAERTGTERAREMARKTLDAMAAGGIYDHLGGGFHRYSTDARWLAPHFEKMLYDQAGLALAYSAAWLVFDEKQYATVTRGILEYVRRDLTHPEGGFYSAEDADSEGEEGTFYVWSAAEIDEVLGSERGASFRSVYKATDMGNWERKNILHVTELDQDNFDSWIEERKILFDHREKRPRPHRDEKIVVSWNGYMIEAMARAGMALNESAYVDAAIRAATFIESNLWKDGRLLRHYMDGAAEVRGYLDDYAFLGRGYLALYEATFDPKWLEQSIHLAREMNRLFQRVDGGYTLSGSDAEELLAPVVESYDGAMPSGNSLAASLLLMLGHLTADNELKDMGWDVLKTFVSSITRNPAAHTEMLGAVDFALGPNTEIVVAGHVQDPAVESMWRALRDRYLPNTVVAFRPTEDAGKTVALIPYLEAQTALDGKATAYVCRDYTCQLPVHDTEGLVAQLKGQ